MTVIVELKCYYDLEDTKEQGITVMEGEWVCQNRGNFLFNCVGFFIDYSVVA
jgi:hypothetical protein